MHLLIWVWDIISIYDRKITFMQDEVKKLMSLTIKNVFCTILTSMTTTDACSFDLKVNKIRLQN